MPKQEQYPPRELRKQKQIKRQKLARCFRLTTNSELPKAIKAKRGSMLAVMPTLRVSNSYCSTRGGLGCRAQSSVPNRGTLQDQHEGMVWHSPMNAGIKLRLGKTSKLVGTKKYHGTSRRHGGGYEAAPLHQHAMQRRNSQTEKMHQVPLAYWGDVGLVSASGPSLCYKKLLLKATQTLSGAYKPKYLVICLNPKTTAAAV